MQGALQENVPNKTAAQSFSNRVFNWIHRKTIQKYPDIPGPSPSFPLGNVKEILGKRPLWEVLGSYSKTYGGMSLIWILSKPSLVLNDPKLIRQVLLTLEQQEKLAGTQTSRCPVTQAMNYYKDLPRKALWPMLTDTSTFEARDQGPAWQNLSANNPFMLSYYEEWIDQQIEPLKNFIKERSQSFAAASTKEDLPAYDTIQELTCQSFAFATIGRSLPSEMVGHFRQMCATGTTRMSLSSLSNNFIFKNPITLKYRKASRKWKKFFSEAYEHVRDNPDAHSLLAWVLKRGESNYSPEDFRNYIAGVYPGGAVSSPCGITSALYCLDQHPEYLEPLQAELKELFSAPLTKERLDNCILLDQLLRETLRLKPPVPSFNRNVGPEGVEINGVKIPGKTQIFIPNWYIHRDPNYWTDAEQFKPERWDEETRAKNTYGSDYFFPFGRGSRACIGQLFAQTVMKLSVAVLIHEFQLEFGKESDDPEFYFAVAVPRKLKVKFTTRP